MLEREAVRFIVEVDRLVMVEVKRFWMAPRLARWLLMVLSALSTTPSASLAPCAVETSMLDTLSSELDAALAAKTVSLLPWPETTKAELALSDS